MLLGPDATPVPGAAATLTRSINTPIPTPIRTPSPAAGPSPSPRPAAPASPSASPAAGQAVGETDVNDVQSQLERAVSTPDMNGIEALLLDHVSLATPQGGDVLDSSQTAQWLRDHAGPGIGVSEVDRSTQEVMLQVVTTGWPKKDPIQSGQVTFSLRRYDADGRQDEAGGGEWKIDVIEVE